MQSRFLTLSFFRSQLIFDTVPAYAVIRADPPLPEEIDLTLYFCYTQLYPIPPFIPYYFTREFPRPILRHLAT